jgi:hypothetical protein
MATPTKYTYSISADFPNGKVDTTRLSNEIRASSISIALDYINTSGDDCDIWFKDVLDTGNQTTLNTVVANHSGEPIPNNEPAIDSNNRTITVPEPETDKAMLNIVTHNFCDKTTWWQQSTAVTDETLTNSGDNLTFNSAHDGWIDLTHGKFYLEDRITDRDNYVPVVKVEGVVKTERTPFSESGGDYTVDYSTGAVTFASAQTGTVTASYYYAGSSLFTVAPDAGKVLWVRDSEVQFSADVEMHSTINFQGFAYNPSDLPNKIPVTGKTNYKTLRNFIEEAKGCYPVIPAIGGSGPRGLTQQHVVFPFKYTQVKALKSSLGLEIRVWMDDDVEFSGEFGTATFYCSSYAE